MWQWGIFFELIIMNKWHNAAVMSIYDGFAHASSRWPQPLFSMFMKSENLKVKHDRVPKPRCPRSRSLHPSRFGSHSGANPGSSHINNVTGSQIQCSPSHLGTSSVRAFPMLSILFCSLPSPTLPPRDSARLPAPDQRGPGFRLPLTQPAFCAA